MLKIFRLLVLCTILALLISGFAMAQNSGALFKSSEAAEDNSFRAILGEIYHEVSRPIYNEFSQIDNIPVSKMFFYIGRPYLPYINWYWLLGSSLLSLAVFLTLALLLSKIMPARIETIGNAISTNFPAVLGWGFLSAILFIPLLLTIAITIIGIPLLLLIYGAAGILGYTAMASRLGKKILNKAHPILALTIGVAIISLVTMVPIFGWLLSLGLLIIALGAVLTTRFGTKSQQNAI